MRRLLPLTFLLLAACGQAGDLYLPAEQAKQPQQQQPPEPTPEKPDEKKDAPKEAR
jgi:predicted small lipoprotein YifL